MLHPTDEGQKPETAVQGLHLLSFRTAHLIFHYVRRIQWCHLPLYFLIGKRTPEEGCV